MTSPLNTTASKNNIYTYGKTDGKKLKLAEVNLCLCFETHPVCR
ncbi:hypothetical protein [Phocaeicola plebeius]|nr:hypothetical protein [Phocaeicola plebeius]